MHPLKANLSNDNPLPPIYLPDQSTAGVMMTLSATLNRNKFSHNHLRHMYAYAKWISMVLLIDSLLICTNMTEPLLSRQM